MKKQNAVAYNDFPDTDSGSDEEGSEEGSGSDEEEGKEKPPKRARGTEVRCWFDAPHFAPCVGCVCVSSPFPTVHLV